MDKEDMLITYEKHIRKLEKVSFITIQIIVYVHVFVQLFIYPFIYRFVNNLPIYPVFSPG